MIAERNEYEQLRRMYAKLNEEARKSNEQVIALEAQNLEQECKLNELTERCSILAEDLKNCDNNIGKEEIVALAWRARDHAVERKNACEIALAKTRIENMQINSQLMEVVQQKGELSRKLAQFEVSVKVKVRIRVRFRKRSRPLPAISL